ncbi:glutathione-independent formaldehyde dehydrogenase [Rubrobacter aplysinae]|uniref:glutathione-independent formaldehyde dehydrogenase n=1 Tax=Rubrobacter aplysinae TaxID=909625 RepID=UPI00064C11C0|nr:glutathione-independent formaldehyde dehydrogenase [Rubrobacter aplysinae]
MKALVYRGPKEVQVENVQDSKIEHPNDVVVKLTTTNICGSDLHMYEGRTPLEEGKVLGHENQGEVVEAGSGVTKVRVGDMVNLPFNISCGFCKNCERGLTNYCYTMQPAEGAAGAAYGFAGMGPYDGGQAEYLRVPFADHNCLILPEDAREKENDYVMLSDIFPTGYHSTEMAGVGPGDSVVISGAGPVGLMAAYSCYLKSASKIMVIDRHPDRLRLAEKIGAIAIDDSAEDPVERVLNETDGEGADCGCEAVGYQAHDHHGNEDPAMTMNTLVNAVRYTGSIGTVGIFLPQDPGSPDELYQEGKVAFDYGLSWFKGQKIGSGQAPVKRYNRELSRLIQQDKAKPSFIVSHELGLDDAPDAYERFDNREDGWTKVVLKPQKAA